MENTNLWIAVGIVVIVLVCIGLFLASRYQVAKETSEILIIKRMNGKIVTAATGAFVWPIINTFQRFSIGRRVINIYSGSERNAVRTEGQVIKIGKGIHCKDNIRADIEVSFYLNASSVDKIAQSFSQEQLTNPKAFGEFFVSKLSEALKTAARLYDFVDLMDHRDQFRESVAGVLSDDLYGFILDDVTIRSIEQFPVDELDDHNILDIQGKEKVTSITATKLTSITQIEEDALTATTERKSKGEQSRLQLNKNLEEEKAKTEREIKVIRARERSATVESEEAERKRQEEAKINADQAIEITRQNTERDVEVAKVQNKQVVGVEEQKVEKVVRLAKIETETEAQQKQLENDVIIEEKNKGVAEVKAQRVSIEKSIAEQEEATKDIHAFKDAERKKKVILTGAEADAEAEKTRIVVAATANKEKAVLNAETEQTNMDVNLKKAKTEAEGKIATAEARRVELAAEGLAQAEVKMRTAEADKIVGETTAENARKIGLAEVEITQKRYEVMDKLPDSVRQHEINLKNIDNTQATAIRTIEKEEKVGITTATANAEMYKNADIKIIGDGGILKGMQDGMKSGARVDALINSSDLLSKVAQPYLNGEKDLPEDIKNIAKELNVHPNSLLSMSLAQLMTSPKAAGLMSKLGLKAE